MDLKEINGSLVRLYHLLLDVIQGRNFYICEEFSGPINTSEYFDRICYFIF